MADTSNLRAFELSSEFKLEDLNGATVAYGPQSVMYDIKQALVDGNGKIVTDDPMLAASLAGHHILVSADVPVKVSQYKLATVPDDSGSSVSASGNGEVAEDIPAAHQDEGLDTSEDELAAGEAVSGTALADKGKITKF